MEKNLHQFLPLRLPFRALQCFKTSESDNAFQLKLLKGGSTIIEGFQAPEKIWKIEEVERGVDFTELRHYQNANNLTLDSSYFELEITYEAISSNVSTELTSIKLNYTKFEARIKH